MLIPLQRDQPLGDQIYVRFREAILDERLRPGERLPSTRELARRLSVARNTVVAAYARLAGEGYVEGRGAAGTRVSGTIPGRGPKHPEAPGSRPGSRRQPRTSRFYRRLSRWSYVYPPAARRSTSLPWDFQYNVNVSDRASRRAWHRILRRRAAVYEGSPPRADLGPGGGPLNVAVARHLEVTRGVSCRPEQVILLNSFQQAFQLAARLLLNPRDAVAIEDPARLGATHAFRTNDLRVIPIPTDAEGLRVDRLPGDPRVRLVYVSPSHLWPTAAVLPLRRRLQLLEWARRRGAWILEHDHNSEYGNWRTPVVSLQGLDGGERVLYVGTFSRLISPEPEIAYAVVPEPLVDGFRAAKEMESYWCAMLETDVLARFLEAGEMQSLLRRLERRLRPLRACLHEAIDALPGRPLAVTPGASGLHVHAIVRGFPVDGLDDLTERCARAGVGIFPDAPYFVRRPRAAGLILGFARLAPEEIREGIRRLGRVLADR